MIYRVTKRYGRGAETTVGSFKSIPEAKAFIQNAIEDDINHKLQVVYSIYEGADLLEEIDSAKVTISSTNSQQEDTSSQSKGAGQRFSPSPLNTTPQPRGIPRSAWKDAEEDKDKK